jgi:hypothetical protein
VLYLKQQVISQIHIKRKNTIVKQIKNFDNSNYEEKATIKTKLNNIDKRLISLSIYAEKSLPRKNTVNLPIHIIDTKRKMIAIRYELSITKKMRNMSQTTALKKEKRQLKIKLRTQIKEYWDNRELTYNQQIDKEGKNTLKAKHCKLG